MPRISRAARHAPGALVHVIIRFVDGRFVLDSDGRRHYLQLLERALRRSDWRLLSYALMSSHIHLAFLMGSAELRSWALSLHVRFAQWINRRLRHDNPGALGHVFADRPWAAPMCVSRTRFLIAYHHQNPHAAGVTESAACSTWTSHRAYVGLASPEGGLDVELGLELSGFGSCSAGRAAFDDFVEGARITLDDVEPSGPPLTVPPVPTPTVSVEASDVLRRAAEMVGVRLEDVLRGSRVRPAVLARRVALVAGLELGHTAAEVATALQISPSGASRLLSRAHDYDAIHRLVERLLSDVGAARASISQPRVPTCRRR